MQNILPIIEVSECTFDKQSIMDTVLRLHMKITDFTLGIFLSTILHNEEIVHGTNSILIAILQRCLFLYHDIMRQNHDNIPG